MPENWVNSYGDFLYRFAVVRVYKPEIAEDLVQDTFVSAFESKDRFKGESSERTWLVSILKRKIVDYFRESARKPETSFETYYVPFSNQTGKEGSWLADRIPADWGKKELEENESFAFMKTLEWCLSQLPAKWAATFSSKAIKEMKTEDICKELNISATNLWVILHRTRMKLRECLENEWLNKQ